MTILIFRMLKISSNIPSTVFYGSVLSEFIRIATCTLLFKDFIPKAVELFQRILTQGGGGGGNRQLIVKQIKNACQRHPEVFQKFHIYM